MDTDTRRNPKNLRRSRRCNAPDGNRQGEMTSTVTETKSVENKSGKQTTEKRKRIASIEEKNVVPKKKQKSNVNKSENTGTRKRTKEEDKNEPAEKQNKDHKKIKEKTIKEKTIKEKTIKEKTIKGKVLLKSELQPGMSNKYKEEKNEPAEKQEKNHKKMKEKLTIKEKRIKGKNIKEKSIKEKPVKEKIITERKLLKSDLQRSMMNEKIEKKKENESSDDDDESDEDDWEEVEELEGVIESPVEMATEDKKNKVIEITLDSPINTKKKKREELWEDYFRREINRHNKEQQIAVHKAHLLCLLALGRYRMRVCVSATLQALSMSVIPNKFTDTQNINVAFLVRFVRWFQSQFKISSTIEEESKQNFDEVLCSRFEDLEVASETEFVYIFASFLHHLHLNVRTIFSLQPISLKTENIIKKPNQKSPKDGELSKPSDKKQIKDKSTSKVIKTKNLKTKNKSRRQNASKVERSKDGSDCDMTSDPESDEDWTEDTRTSKGPKSSATKRSKITASESKEGKEKKKVISVGTDVWVEVYLESLQKWVSIDCLRGVINHPEKCESYATQPVIYIMSFSTDGSIKDLTKKYASKWMTHTRKLRIDNIKPKWWLATLKPFKTENGDKNETEDQLLNANLLNKPMPTSVSEFKNHPLYALKRHLLKFEAIYPKTAEILGYCRGEAIYSRDCVHELHAKETWIKEARSVRIGEEPYKFVKARPKPHHKKTGETPPPVAVYGHWQTEKFMAPPAVDGKVPRNEHGNVELYKPEMLPPGTVHLQIPGLNKVARKLDIDCAQAMVGWDFHCGYSHPVFDGVVVCEEFQEILLDAWQKEQLETERKNDEKRELRALKNWRQLTKGLLIRERLNRRFQSSYEDIPPNQDESVSDVTMAFPLNRDMKHSKDSTHLFPFEKL